MFAFPLSSLHALQIFGQRINEDAANSPRRDIVTLGRECNYLLLVGLPQLVLGDAAVKLSSIVMMERSTIRCLQLLGGRLGQSRPGWCRCRRGLYRPLLYWGCGGRRLNRLRLLFFVVLCRVVRVRKRRIFILVVALASFKLIVE